jgi:hypothetical protein
MYGECITDLGNGSAKLEGCERKYSHVDQYLMGLRGVNEMTPMMVFEDPTNLGHGVDSIAMGRSTAASTVNNLTRHDITGDEIVRAMGARIPGYPNAQSCWRVAFMVVLAPGQTTIPQAMLDKVNRYRARWSPWFNNATDGRGTMDTRLTGNGCLVMDAGVVTPTDAGTVETDAGSTVEDAGVGADDAGVGDVDAGEPLVDTDAGTGISKEDTRVNIGTIRPGCGCNSGGIEFASLLGAITIFISRRRRA